MVAQFFGDLKNEFRGYGLNKLLKDLMAGLTVTAVALPLALAFGVSGGMDAAAGLITAILAGLVIGALSGAYYQISGPTGAMSAVLISVGASLGVQGVFLATLLAGFFLVLMGLLRLGRLTSWIPAPVITGFTSGIAVIIALGQIDNLFGVVSEGETAAQRLLSYAHLGFHPDPAPLCVGLFVILFMVFYPKKWSRAVPSSLAAIILATAACAAFGIDAPVVGNVPRTLMPAQRLTLAHINSAEASALLGPALSIAMLGAIESLLCGAAAGRMTGARLNADRELVAQGIGNILIPFFGGVPATAAIARTSVAIRSGALTRLAGIFHALGLLLSMFVLAPVMSKIPLAALAGVLIVTAWRMNEWHSIRHIFSKRFKGAMLKFSVTMAATVLFDLNVAIAVGVSVGLLLFIGRSARIDVAVERLDPASVGVGDAERPRNWAVIYITGPLFFVTAETVQRRLEELRDPELIIFSLRGVPHVDITSLGLLMDYYKRETEKGRRVLFASVQPAVMKSLERAGIAELAGESSFHPSVDHAVLSLLGRPVVSESPAYTSPEGVT